MGSSDNVQKIIIDREQVYKNSSKPKYKHLISQSFHFSNKLSAFILNLQKPHNLLLINESYKNNSNST